MGRTSRIVARAHRLKKLGFDSYQEYLESGLWREVRSKVLDSKGRYCELCGNTASQVHHRRYRPMDLNGQNLCFLHPLCSACHRSVHFKGDRHVTHSEMRKRFRKMRRAFLKTQ